MIISGFLYLASTILTLILAVFPASAGLPSEFTSALSTFSGYVGIIDPLVPVATLATAVGIVMSYELVVFTFKGLVWTYQRIPFVGK